MLRTTRPLIVSTVSLLAAGPVLAQSSFVNWETPPVHPVEVTPDGTRLIVANTADDRIEVFNLATGWPVRIASIPAGINPVSVRARSNSEIWVVNHLSDSVSVVDLGAFNVMATLRPGDEPTDVVFAGTAASGAARAFVSVSQRNQVVVYDSGDLAAAPVTLEIAGEDPRALATDGTRVYAAIFESGNDTTIISQQTVSDPAFNPYPGDPNPPPNDGSAFNPPINPNYLPGGSQAAPGVGLILRRDGNGWVDDNGFDWSSAVTWNLLDHDVAIIDAGTLAISYASGLMNMNMSLTVQPGSGLVTVVGTEATNDIRFEPNVRGTFVRVHMASFDPAAPELATVIDLNQHLNYAVQIVPQEERDESIGDPRGIIWNSAGTRGYVTGMGSNNVVVLDSNGLRLNRIEVGQGPTGLAWWNGTRLIVLNRFDGTISVIDANSETELGRVSFFDPTPAVVRDGRPFLYDTHRTSGLGQASCGSCHVDAHMDQVAWDLGNPEGAVDPFFGSCNAGIPIGGACGNFHPMKGPMTTQTLVGIIETGRLHWRGDRQNLAAFNPAFVGLLGDDVQLTTGEMTQFTNFIQSIRFKPNPNRNLNNTLPTSISGFTGNPVSGQSLFLNAFIDGGLIQCDQCHTLPTGSLNTVISAAALQETQSFKVPQLRNMYEKTGFLTTSQTNNRGFGFLHDGSIDTLFEFLQADVFIFPAGQTGINQRRDIEAFLMCFETTTHASVGTPLTVNGSNNTSQPVIDQLNAMIAVANSAGGAMIAKGWINGEQRGYTYIAGTGNFQSDRQAEVISATNLRLAATNGGEVTFTMVPTGTQTRAGTDRDLDGVRDHDEIDAFSDPANPASTPANAVTGDMDGDGDVDAADYQRFAGCLTGAAAGPVVSPCIALDVDIDTDVDLLDLATWTNAFAP